MELKPGAKLGPYEIVSMLGKGGMGEVWKAHDPQIGRDVAIKVSAQQFTDRFEREVRAIGSLNHPNICTLYHVGPNYLVMELVEGPTLAERIKEGPIPLDEALGIAKQIADALEAAHEKNIVHRDLKPANVKIRPDGSVKVLDFGLAKAGEAQEVTPDSPTMMPGTQIGMILGTAGYMSPEQARGKEVDKRADIWAFGVVLYEMVTGKRLFEGETVSDSLAAVLTREPDLAQAPGKTRRLLASCLEKDPKKRLRDIGDLWRLLDESPAPAARPRRFMWLPWATAVVLAVVAVLGWTRTSRPTVTAPVSVALSVIPPRGTELIAPGGLGVEKISPDGAAVMFRTIGIGLNVRRLDSMETKPVPPFDSSGAAFWAPDSKSIAFPAANGLFKMHLPGGAPQLVSQDLIIGERGGTWAADGTILFATVDSSPGGIGLHRVSADGGKPQPVEVQGLKEGRYYNPEFLPGRSDFLFAFSPQESTSTQIYLATLRDGKAVDAKLLFENETSVTFTPAGGGRVVFVRNDNLYSQRLDLTVRKLVGEPELVQERVISDPGFRDPNFSVSASGTLEWRSGTAIVSQLAAFDRKGNRTGTAGPPAPFSVVNLSPDETHFLAEGEAGSWIMEVNGSGRLSQGNASALRTQWSPGGGSLIEARDSKLVELSLNRSRVLRELAEISVSPGERILLHAVGADGRRIVYSDQSGLYFLSLPEKQTSQLAAQRVDNAAMSPDAKWIVYHPNTESGIYVQPLSGNGLRRQIANSGNFPVWRGDGKEIVYYDQGHIWSVGVQGSGDESRFSEPELLFTVARPMGLASASRPLAVTRDGSRIYCLQSAEQPDAGVINVRTDAIR